MHEGKYIKIQGFEKKLFLYVLFMTVHIDLELFHKNFAHIRTVLFSKEMTDKLLFVFLFSSSVGQRDVFIFCSESVLKEQEIWRRGDSMLSCASFCVLLQGTTFCSSMGFPPPSGQVQVHWNL